MPNAKRVLLARAPRELSWHVGLVRVVLDVVLWLQSGGYYNIVAIESADWRCLQLLRSWKCLSAPDVLKDMASGLCRSLTSRDQRLRC